jgi:hypothetical protein
MKDFNIAKYLRENYLGSHGLLGKYVDLHALKEEEVGNNKPVDEVPYVGADTKLDGFGDEFDQVQPVSENENDIVTIELDMAWDNMDPEEDAAAQAAFDQYGIEVQEINGNPGTFEVTGRKEDILAYLTSKFYDMEEEDIAYYYPELLDSELEELEKPENIYANDQEQVDDTRMMDLGGDQIEQGIISLLDDGFEPEDILDACKMFINAHVNAAMQGKKF